MVTLDIISTAQNKRGRNRQVALDEWCHPTGAREEARGHRALRAGGAHPDAHLRPGLPNMYMCVYIYIYIYVYMYIYYVYIYVYIYIYMLWYYYKRKEKNDR